MTNFIRYNRNPLHNDTHDCAIRALSTALNIKYTDVLKALNIPFNKWLRITTGPTLVQIKNAFGNRFKKYRQIKENKKVTLKTLASRLVNGKFLAFVVEDTENEKEAIHHLVYVSDGSYYDTFDSGNYLAYYYIEIN